MTARWPPGGVDGRLAGFLALSDTLRPQAAQTIQRTQAAGVEPVLLTGDNANAAQHIAGQLGIPHHTLDLSGPFQEQVMEPFVQAYEQGRTRTPV